MAALVACLAVLAGPAAGQALAVGEEGFSVAPLRHDVETAAGAKSSHTFTITNATSISQTYTLSKEDFAGDRTDPDATPVLLGGRFDSSISGYDWIRNIPGSVVIPANQSKTVTVNVEPPSGATGGHYAAVVVSGPSKTSGDVTATSRVAVLFLMNAGGAPPPEIIIDDVTQTTGGETVVRYINEDQVHDTPTATITYVDRLGNPVEEVIAERCSTALPGGSGSCTFPAPTKAGLVPGWETGQVELVTGDGDRVTAGVPVQWAGSWSSLILPIVGIGLFGAYFFFLRRRLRDDDEDGADPVMP